MGRRGRFGCVGVDLSRTTDMTALCAAFAPEKGLLMPMPVAAKAGDSGDGDVRPMTSGDPKYIEVLPDGLGEGPNTTANPSTTAKTDAERVAAVLEARIVPLVPREHRVSVFHKYYMPAQGIKDKEDKDRLPYREWAMRGWLTLTDGWTVDYGVVRAQLKAWWKTFNIGMVAFDPKYASYLTSVLEDEDKMTVKNFDQRGFSMGTAMSECQRLILTGQLEHEDNPITKVHRASVQVKYDGAGNPRPVKSDADAGQAGDRRLHVDGIVAMAMGVFCCVTEAGKHRGSPYRGRGIRSLSRA